MSRLSLLAVAAALAGCTTANLIPTGEEDAGGSGFSTSSSTGNDHSGTLRLDGGGIPDAAGTSGAAGACTWGTPGPEDKERVLLTSRAYLPDGGKGTSLRSLSVMADGTPVDNGVTLDVGERVDRIAFVPSGELALVLGEDS